MQINIHYNKNCFILGDNSLSLEESQMQNSYRALSLKEITPSFLLSIKEEGQNFKIETSIEHNSLDTSNGNITDSLLCLERTFPVITASGGIIVNTDGDILLIKRNGFWDFPKGKQEVGETPLENAKREITEETGVDALTPLKELPTSYYFYDNNFLINGKVEPLILKKVFWFEFQTLTTKNILPQEEEGITDIIWVNRLSLLGLMANTFPSIRDLTKIYLS